MTSNGPAHVHYKKRCCNALKYVPPTREFFKFFRSRLVLLPYMKWLKDLSDATPTQKVLSLFKFDCVIIDIQDHFYDPFHLKFQLYS